MDKNDTLERTIVLLEYAAGAKGFSFVEADKMLGGIAPSTLTRLLKKLCACGMLEHDATGLYRPAPRFNQLAAKVMKLQPRHEMIRPAVQQLAMMTGQSAAYFEKAEGGAILLAKHEMPEAFHYIAEGEINREVETQGFIKIIYNDNPPDVLTVIHEQREFMRRVVCPVKLPDADHGAIGITFFCGDFSAVIRATYEEQCRQCAKLAEDMIKAHNTTEGKSE